MTLTQITEKGIKDGEIVNADINASAAIAGSKITPVFTADGSISKATPQFKIHSNDNDMTMGEEVGRYAIWTSDGSAPGGGEVFRIKTESSSSLGLDYTTRLYNRQGSGGGGTEISLGNGQGSIYFGTNTTGNAGAVTRMAVMSDGKVGVGTTSPGYNVEISGAGSGSGVSLGIKNTGASPAGINLLSSHGNWSIYNSHSVGDALEFRDESASTVPMLINSSGNVGINTSSPSRRLEVADATFPAIRIKNSNTSIANDTNIAGLEFEHADSSAAGVCAGINARMADTSTGALHMTFSTGTNVNLYKENMRLDSSGRLLINTTSGHGKLQLHDGSFVHSKPAGGGTRNWRFVNNNTAVGDYGIQISTTEEGSTYANHTELKAGGDVQIHDGNLVLASGHGIDFSATFDGSNVSGVSASSELLDDYEEGTFQPILKRLMSNNVTETNFYTQQTRQGNYTRIGDRVWITGRCHWNGGSTGSGTTILTNLPFTINTGGANEIPLNIGYRSGWNYTNITAYGGQNMNRFYINFFDSNGSYPLSPSAASSTGSLYFAAHYELV